MENTSNNVQTITTKWSSNRPEDCFSVENPATGQIIAHVQGASPAEVDIAVAEADKVWRTSWRWTPPQIRAALLMDCARVLQEHADEIAKIESEEVGKPFNQARAFDLEATIGVFKLFSGLIAVAPSEVQDQGPFLKISTLEPYGVVGGIIPFNWPPIHTAGKSAPALAMGNCVVLKPPEQCPFTIMRVVELMNTVLPAGVLTVVPGLGSCGEALASHPLVRMISFTGSPNTGKAVMRTMSQNLTPGLMELGGKNPIIIFEDADIEQALRGIIDGAFFNQGEACTAASRIIVHSSLYDKVVERLKEAVPKLRVGDPADSATHVGPLVTAAQQKRVLEYLDIGVAEGARIAAQAPLPNDERLSNGFWVPPTLFTDVRPDMRIAREEIFGPVTVVISFDTYDKAIEIANNTDFGLIAGVYSSDFTKIWKTSREIDAGIIFANNYFRATIGTAFGGTKNSGFGREHALETLREYGRTKSVRIATGVGKTPPLWFAVSEVLDK